MLFRSVSFVQRFMWRVVERAAMMIFAVRIDWKRQYKNDQQQQQQQQRHAENSYCDNYNNSSSTDTTATYTRGGWGGGMLWESHRNQILHQLSLITTTRTKLDRLPDIINNTPPSLSLFALVTAVAFIVHPDGLTWIVLGKLCEGIWFGLRLLQGVAATIVAASLSAFSSSSSSSSDHQGENYGGSSISKIGRAHV